MVASLKLHHVLEHDRVTIFTDSRFAEICYFADSFEW